MLRSQIEILLGCYKNNQLRLRHIASEATRIRREIARIESDAVGLSAQRMTGMPPSGILRDDTANKAALLADGELGDVNYLHISLDRLKAERARVKLEISCVENWLSALDEREKHVVREKMVLKRTWQDVSDSYEREFGYGVSETTLRRLKASALYKICAIAG